MKVEYSFSLYVHIMCVYNLILPSILTRNVELDMTDLQNLICKIYLGGYIYYEHIERFKHIKMNMYGFNMNMAMKELHILLKNIEANIKCYLK